ncbi:MAG TPA: AMP-binding protein, partial [Chloroflexota bacterium]|nr:AMP-binding protein [Chloroflexota bacterium]
EDLAFLQYTSGSTSAPKGVAVTYANLGHQLEMQAAAFKLGRETRAVFWMPHYHDFCLVGGVLGALHGNGQVFLLAPDSFLRRPAVWPEVLSRVRATHTGASNFGYELVVQRTTPEQRAGWDLSALRVAVSAAEPVRRRTAEAFVDAFTPAGLRAETFCTAYGLAEHTVGISLGGRRWRRRHDTDVASCGVPGQGVEVRIVDPESGRPMPDGETGELWVRSPSVCAGYYGLPDETRATFQARIAGGDDAAGAYLRTGDLAFLDGGEVFVCGRLKDLIIVRGRNVYPQDIEADVEASHPLLLAGGAVAFSVPDEPAGEALVVVAEVRARRVTPADGAAISRAVDAAARRRADVACRAVVLVQPGAVPRTTSGKVRRHAARDSYLEGRLMNAESTLHVEWGEEPTHRLVRGMDAGFRRVAGRAIDAVYKRASGMRRRAAHGTGAAAVGTLRVLEEPGIPLHRLFAPGARYRVVLRHSSNKGFEDDAIADVRGAALRLLPADSTGLARETGVLDLVLATGVAFFLPTAEAFVEFALGTPESRLATLRRHPSSAGAIRDIIRDPDSFTALDYESQVTHAFVGEDGVERLVRYRLTPLERRPTATPNEHGWVAPERVQLPLEYAPRLPGDTRSLTYLREDFGRRVAEGGVRYCLQLQVRDADGAERREALDCTVPWPTERFPWLDVAAITLDEALAPEAEAELSFDPAAAPGDLAFIPATSADDPASINHLRGLAYEASAHARAGRALPADLAALVQEAEAAGNPVAAYGEGALALPEALAAAALGLHFTQLPLSDSEPLQQVEAALRRGPLSQHGAALEEVTRLLREAADETRLRAAAAAPPDATAVGPRFADTFEHVTVGDAAAVLAATQAYDLPCLELLRWRERFSCRLFQDRSELAAYLAGTPEVAPAESRLPAAVLVDEETVLAVSRYASVLP